MRVLLHFIGKATYSEELFKAEAKKYGVNRALPPRLALKLKPGDIILLAFKERDYARVFGYMVVDGYTISSNVLDMLGKYGQPGLECTSVDIIEKRGCGDIRIISVCTPQSKWEYFTEKLKNIVDSLNNVKIFVHGKFYELTPFTIRAKFTMCGMWVDIKDLPANVVDAIKPCVRVFDDKTYNRRIWTPSKLKTKLTRIHSNIESQLTRWIKSVGQAS